MTTIQFILDPTQLTKKDLAIYSCFICRDISFDDYLYQCSKGHTACKGCWARHLRTKKTCMECIEKINSLENLSTNRKLRELLFKKKFKCPYHYSNIIKSDDSEPLTNTGDGCKEIIIGEKLKNHIENCEYRFVKCKNEKNGCNFNSRFKLYHSHEDLCLYKYIPCFYCKSLIVKNNEINHQVECESFPVECKLCQNQFEKREINDHLANNCLESLIPCPLEEFGCKEKEKRSKIQDHLNGNHNTIFIEQIKKIHQLQNEIYNQNQSIINQNETISRQGQEINNLKENIHIIKKDLENFKLNLPTTTNEQFPEINKIQKPEIHTNYYKNFSYKNTWIIENYSKITSTICNVSFDPFNFEINLNKREINGENVVELSVYYCKDFEINVNFSFILQNHKKITTLKERFNKDFTEKYFLKKTAYGWQKAFREAINKKNGWLTKDDTMVLEITFKCSSIVKPLFS
ncbi:hypothetical protein DICPUDRAFT_74976 [Dictyostelium purpureum]|uniref:TRAF-type domain-containing protein n=1 Tax=Dictyostelium purpureum TaxID=5786 RepID=F0Z9A2_DICPU|nr:uncharacterized protein DICPUDRAFT_74976 [Dictyostelium purpureum]EGC39434.1 hypothetical protein DICPUDRAFT_74976 [Dictyostelium purpureum]|eukprot:XP_003283992.1 hypothetical protein DICPUDRAFT_74976 [Dictyostelium purpureum]